MKISNIQYFWKNEFLKRLRDVTLLEDPSIKIYKDCFISLELVDPDILIPCQTYVLNSELQKVKELMFDLKKQYIDIFRLNGFVTFETKEKHYWNYGYTIYNAHTHALLPPIVEESIENDGRILPLLNDGMHRIYYARMIGSKVLVAYIRGIDKKYPYYAYSLKNGWDDVQRVDSIPDGFIKKWHRIKDNKKLYRNFNSVFEECSEPRGVIK